MTKQKKNSNMPKLSTRRTMTCDTRKPRPSNPEASYDCPGDISRLGALPRSLTSSALVRSRSWRLSETANSHSGWRYPHRCAFTQFFTYHSSSLIGRTVFLVGYSRPHLPWNLRTTWSGKWKTFLILTSDMARWNISSIGKATDPTNAPGNLRSTFPTLQKRSPSSIYVTRTVQLPRTYAPALRLAAAVKTSPLIGTRS